MKIWKNTVVIAATNAHRSIKSCSENPCRIDICRNRPWSKRLEFGAR